MEAFLYFLNNVKLWLFPNLETFKLFSNLKKDWQKNDWDETYETLKLHSNWVPLRQIFHKKITYELIQENNNNLKKIETIIQKKLGHKLSPSVIIVRGQPGAGKSTFIKNVFKIKSGVIGPDNIRSKLKKFAITGTKDNQYDLEAYFVTLWTYEKIFSLRKSFITERTLEYVEDLEMIINMAIKNEYKIIYVVDILASLDASLSRLKDREVNENNPVIPTKAVIDAYVRVSAQRKIFIDKLKMRKIKCIYEAISSDSLQIKNL